MEDSTPFSSSSSSVFNRKDYVKCKSFDIPIAARMQRFKDGGVRNGKVDLNPKMQILDPQKAVNTTEE